VYLSNDLQVATSALGSRATDLRIQPEARGYVPLARGVTFALRGTVGLILSPNYGSAVQADLAPRLPNGAPSQPVPSDADLDRDIENIYFRGFFSGGPSSNRGFPLRGVGPYGTVPFLNPGTASTQVLLNCDPHSPGYNPSQCALPIGGLTLWEASAEVRFDVSGPLGMATFCDAGDVSAYAEQIRLNHLHLSCGVGARYDTPVGPIRLDIGYRIQPLQVLPYPDESSAYQADPSNGLPARILGLPLAFAFGIGEAF
ncbi:MAG: BamA/TamA family outer membrane protein, partial [Polyangiaceae bacterium]